MLLCSHKLTYGIVVDKVFTQIDTKYLYKLLIPLYIN